MDFRLVELDQCGESRNGDVQSILHKLTKRRTVPNIIVGGKSIGGGDEVATLLRKGKLVGILKKAGCTFSGGSA